MDLSLPNLSALGPARKRAARAPAQRGPEPPLPGHPLWEALPHDAQDEIARLLRPEAPSEEACERIERLCEEYGFRQCRLQRFWDELNAAWGWYGPHDSWEQFAAARAAGRVRFLQQIVHFNAFNDDLATPLQTPEELPRSPRDFFRTMCQLHAALRAMQQDPDSVGRTTLAHLSLQNFQLPAEVFVPFNRELALANVRQGAIVSTSERFLEHFIYSDDLEFARAAVAHSAVSLSSFSDRTRDDFETMRVAVQQSLWAFNQASARLRGNVTFCLIALQNDPSGFAYDDFLEPAKTSPEVVMQLARMGRWVPLWDVLPRMVDHPIFFHRLVREFPQTLKYFGFLWLEAGLKDLYVNLAREALARDPSVEELLLSSASPRLRTRGTQAPSGA